MMPRTPRVSVLLPTYQSAHLLDEAIQSVLDQTFTDYELIIVDNASSDNTDEVVGKYLSDPRISYHKNPTNLGLSGNWNKCLEYATTPYIKYICSDDKLHPRILEKFVPVLDENPGVVLVGCYKQQFGGMNVLWEIPFHHRQPGPWVVLETVKHYNYLGETTCVMFRKEAVEKVGAFGNYTWITDWEMYVRLLAVGDCYIVPERLAFTRDHAGQVTKKVFAGCINYIEEYTMFRALRDGRYNLDLSAHHAELDEAIRLKAWECTKSMSKTVAQLKTPKGRSLFRQGMRIALAEGMLIRGILYFPKRRLGRMLKLEVGDKKIWPKGTILEPDHPAMSELNAPR